MSTMLQDLINSMQEIVEEAKSVPLMADRCIVDREKLLFLINETIRCLPEDLDMARDIVERRNNIISEAKSQSENIIAIDTHSSPHLEIGRHESVVHYHHDILVVFVDEVTAGPDVNYLHGGVGGSFDPYKLQRDT